MAQIQKGWQVLKELETKDNRLFLRRFMNFSKFQHLINTQTLYFSPASEFDDNLEGHYTSKDHEEWDGQLANLGLDSKTRKMAMEAKSAVAYHNQTTVVISCWTTAPVWNARMWKEYAGGIEAVVIETTVKHLRNTLGNEFLIVPIQYLDFKQENIPKKEHSLQPFCYKQKNRYQWEHEVRIIGEMEIGKRIGSPREIPINISNLITKISLHPKASQPFINSVIELVKQSAPNTICEIFEV